MNDNFKQFICNCYFVGHTYSMLPLIYVGKKFILDIEKAELAYKYKFIWM